MTDKIKELLAVTPTSYLQAAARIGGSTWADQESVKVSIATWEEYEIFYLPLSELQEAIARIPEEADRDIYLTIQGNRWGENSYECSLEICYDIPEPESDWLARVVNLITYAESEIRNRKSCELNEIHMLLEKHGLVAVPKEKQP